MFNFITKLFNKNKPSAVKTKDVKIMSGPSAQSYVSKKVPAFPYDRNFKPAPMLVLSIIDPDTGEITGYLPAGATDNGDGTASLKVDTEFTIENITVNNVKVGSSDGQTSGNKYLKVDADGTLHVAVDTSPATPTINVAGWGGVLQTGVDLTPLFQHLNADLSTLAKEEDGNLESINTNTEHIGTPLQDTKIASVIPQEAATFEPKISINKDNVGLAKESGGNLASIKTDLDNIYTRLDVALSTRASETTLSSIKTDLEGKVSTLNSTITPLGISGIFTGTWEDVTNYSSLTLTVFSDQNSATDGLEFDWSHDGSNVDRVEPTALIVGSTGRAFNITVRGRYFRIKYTNGIIAQSIFRLGVVYHAGGSGLITKRLATVPNDDNFGLLTQTIMAGKSNVGGQYYNINANDVFDEKSLHVVSGPIEVNKIQENYIYSFAFEFNLITAGIDNNFVLIRNPSGSNKVLYLKTIILDVLTKGGQAAIKLWADPTITVNGTAQTVMGRNIGNGAGASVILVTSGPTSTAKGIRITGFSCGKDSNSMIDAVDYTLALQPNHSILVTGDPDANNRVVTATMIWIEK